MLRTGISVEKGVGAIIGWGVLTVADQETLLEAVGPKLSRGAGFVVVTTGLDVVNSISFETGFNKCVFAVVDVTGRFWTKLSICSPGYPNGNDCRSMIGWCWKIVFFMILTYN